jgi:hypothetical protein
MKAHSARPDISGNISAITKVVIKVKVDNAIIADE